MKYLIDFDTRLSENKQTLELLRNNQVFEKIEGEKANEIYKKLVKIDDLKLLGFSYCYLEFDGKLDEWYELRLVEQNALTEGVSLMYHPETDLFEVPENGFVFSKYEKVEKYIKAFSL